MSAIFWSRPGTSGGGPLARGGHTANMIGNLLVVFGGTCTGESGKFHYFDDVWVLDTDASPMHWSKPRTGGASAPVGRYAHASCLIGNKVYIYGGRGANGAVLTDLWELDIEKWFWKLMISSTAPPPPRFAHTLTAVGGQLLVFGGWDGRVARDDVWVFDRVKGTWSRPRVTGTPPSARAGHAAALDVRAGRLLVFGGASYDSDRVPTYLRDTIELDLVAMNWSRPRVTGDYPAARTSAATATLANVLVLFGGWAGPAPLPSPPPPTDPSTARFQLNHHAGLGFGSIAPPGATVNVPYGPHAGTSLLDLDSGEWVAPHVAGDAPGDRHGSSASARGLRLFMFGGWESGRPFNELLVLDLSALAGE